MNKDVSKESRELKTFSENLDDVFAERGHRAPEYTCNDEGWKALQRTLDQIVLRLRGGRE